MPSLPRAKYTLKINNETFGLTNKYNNNNKKEKIINYIDITFKF